MALALCLTSAPADAEAQTVPAAAADTDIGKLARSHFNYGVELWNQGRYVDACAHFAESHRLEPYPSKLLHLGKCHARENRPATAIRRFNEVFQQLSTEPDPEWREIFANEARARIQELAPQVATLRLEASPTAGAVVRLQGQPTSPGEALPLDPGVEYVLEVSAPGHRTRRESVKLGPAQRLVYPLPALAPEPAPARRSRFGLAPPLLLGAGALLASGAVYFGVEAMSDGRRLERDCRRGLETETCRDLDDEWKSEADTATWLWLGAGLLAGTGITLYVLDATASASEVTPTVARVSAWAVPGMAAVGASGHF